MSTGETDGILLDAWIVSEMVRNDAWIVSMKIVSEMVRDDVWIVLVMRGALCRVQTVG